MYINVVKIIRVPIILIGFIITGFGVYKFIVALNINQQIASTLVAMFGIEFMWFFLWIFRGKK